MTCIKCGRAFNAERYKLGFRTCLTCGENEAITQAEYKSKCVAPMYNKGAYQYIATTEVAKDIGK